MKDKICCFDCIVRHHFVLPIRIDLIQLAGRAIRCQRNILNLERGLSCETLLYLYVGIWHDLRVLEYFLKGDMAQQEQTISVDVMILWWLKSNVPEPRIILR
jgi:hypothetical protein